MVAIEVDQLLVEDVPPRLGGERAWGCGEASGEPLEPDPRALGRAEEDVQVAVPVRVCGGERSGVDGEVGGQGDRRHEGTIARAPVEENLLTAVEGRRGPARDQIEPPIAVQVSGLHGGQGPQLVVDDQRALGEGCALVPEPDDPLEVMVLDEHVEVAVEVQVGQLERSGDDPRGCLTPRREPRGPPQVAATEAPEDEVPAVRGLACVEGHEDIREAILVDVSHVQIEGVALEAGLPSGGEVPIAFALVDVELRGSPREG